MGESALLAQLSEEVQLGHVKEAANLTQQCLDEGMDAQIVLNGGLLNALDELSIRFRNSEIFIAELLQATKAFNVGLSMIKDLLIVGDTQITGKVVIATVEGDLHDIGKNIVKNMLECVGLEVKDLGADVSTIQLIEAVERYQPDIVALSAFLTTTMEKQREIIEALKQIGLRDKVKVIIGGAPITLGFCRSVGADGYAADAAGAVTLVRRIMASD